MVDEVKKCIEIRTEFFSKYYIVPQSMQADVDAFTKELYNMGENCTDSMDFEQRFAGGGYSEKFNSLLMSCTPKPVSMTEEQKQYSKQVEKELYKESGGSVVRDIVDDVADTMMVEAEEEAISQRRKAMIEAGVFDDYTRATNHIENAKGLFGFFKNKFGKNKNNKD
ncbi:MAG: hypothetical protein II998_05360 [Clostridia bacterium]|nr:hypothetical protein [Clostridia bacterium]